MKYIIFSIGLVFIFTNILFSQDVIIKKNGDELNTKVLEVGGSIVKYKRFDNIDGPTYEMNKSEIFMIKYQNGTKDVFQSDLPVQQPSSTPLNNGYYYSNVSRKIRIAGNAFYYNEMRQNDISVINVMKMNGDEQSVLAYKKGWGMQRAGSPLLAVGIPALIVGVFIASLSNNTTTSYSNGVQHTTSTNNQSLVVGGAITTLVGLASAVTGIVLKVNGKKKKALAVREYNKKIE